MHIDQESLRLIFGLKLRTLRKDKGFSLKNLAQATGLSPSYINEIEKGKKYPRGEKVLALADALETSYDDLISLKMKDELRSLSDLLSSNLLTGLPFDVFGIETRSLFELISQSPERAGALMATILELTRHHNIGVESVFLATLRAYLDLNDNFFEELEQAVDVFRAEFPQADLSELDEIKDLLQEKFGSFVTEEDFHTFPEALQTLDYFVKKNKKSSKLYINSRNHPRKNLSLLACEIGYQFLKLKDRRISPLNAHLDSYQQLLNDFQANYFASALLIPKDPFIQQMGSFFSRKTYNDDDLLSWMKAYPGSYTMFFERLTQCLPKFFGLDQLFLLRIVYNQRTKKYKIDRELHLSSLHSPHRVDDGQHYCRRWLSCSLINDLPENSKDPIAATQISNFVGTTNQYFCLSAAWQQETNPDLQSCITLGVFVNEDSRKAIQFSLDDKILNKTVCSTCERCPIENCQERVADNSLYHQEKDEKEISSFCVQ